MNERFIYNSTLRMNMTYRIKQYQEAFLEAQERVGKEVTKNWAVFGQTPADQLKKAYSQPGFDPETRHYCFKVGELIGFLTSEVLEEVDGVRKANLEFPLVLPGHEEVESLLYEKAIKVLKKKGVTAVRSRVSDSWGKTVEMAERYGYAFLEERAVDYSTDVDAVEIKDMPEHESMIDYDHQRDCEQMIEIFIREYDQTPEQARTNFEAIDKASDQVVCHLVIRKGEVIVGRALALRNEEDPNQAYTGNIYVTDKDQRLPFMMQILKICKEKGIKTLHVPLYGKQLSQKDQFSNIFESLGFSQTTTISYYEKEI